MSNDKEVVSALVPEEDYEKVSAAPHGALSKEIRKAVHALATGEVYDPTAGEDFDYLEEKYNHLTESDRPDDWEKRRKEVFRRDAYTCQNCMEKGGMDGEKNLTAHHIVPAHSGGNHYLSNLITLCESCHANTHASF